jgi:hypothetical protein
MWHFGVGIDCDRILLAHISFSFIYNCATLLEIFIESNTFYQHLLVCSVHACRSRFIQHSGSISMEKAIESKQ